MDWSATFTVFTAIKKADQENEWTFAQHDKQGVAQFHEFREGEKQRPGRENDRKKKTMSGVEGKMIGFKNGTRRRQHCPDCKSGRASR